jgi:hypothetical protein
VPTGGDVAGCRGSCGCRSRGDQVGHHERDRRNEEDGSAKCFDWLVPRIGQMYRCRIFGREVPYLILRFFL